MKPKVVFSLFLFASAHAAGTVQLVVVCDNRVSSNTVPFDYRLSAGPRRDATRVLTDVERGSQSSASEQQRALMSRLETLAHMLSGGQEAQMNGINGYPFASCDTSL